MNTENDVPNLLVVVCPDLKGAGRQIQFDVNITIQEALQRQLASCMVRALESALIFFILRGQVSTFSTQAYPRRYACPPQSTIKLKQRRLNLWIDSACLLIKLGHHETSIFK